MHDVPDVSVSSATVHSCVVVTVSGELDMFTVPTLRTALEEHLDGEAPLVVDLTGVTFMDSTSLALLISIRRRLPASAALRLAGAIPAVARIFTLTGLEKVFPMFDTLDEATR